jgi:5,10-methylenetetrahydromethanopterin reductase
MCAAEEAMPLTIDVPVPLSLPPGETVRYVQRIEALGFHGAGIPDHPEQGHDVFVLLALAAANTSRIVLYPSVTNPVMRHPLTLANLANTLNEVAPGRIKLAIAAGDSALKPTGRPPATVAEMRSAVSLIRRLLRGEAARVGEGQEEFSIPVHGPPPAVVVTGSGAKLMEVAGEVGDEAMLMAGLDPRMLARALRHLEIGARRAGRSLDGFPVTQYFLVSIDDNVETARERSRRWLHRWMAQGLFRGALEEVGLEGLRYARPEDIPREMLARLCDLLFIVGSPEQCAERFQELAAQGVEHVACLIPGGPAVSERTIELLAKHMLDKAV